MGTLWSALEGSPDRRTLKGRRCSRASIMALPFAAMLSGANDLRAIYQEGDERRARKKTDALAPVPHQRGCRE